MTPITTRRSFTLIELLVVMGVIAVLAGITALGYRGIAKDAKLSSAKNTIMAVLDNARGLAMKNNEIVCVVFRARLDGNQQYIETVTAKWSRHSASTRINFGNAPSMEIIDRFVPIPGTPVRRLPAGIKMAAPFYGSTQNLDDQWLTNSHLPLMRQSGSGKGQGESPGGIMGVMYSPNGSTITRNSHTDSNRTWIDFNRNGVQDWAGASYDYYMPPQPGSQAVWDMSADAFSEFFEQHLEHDECHIDFVPFLAVFDDDEARELYDVSQWNMLIVGSNPAEVNRQRDYTEYITNNADRIHFNRYTGVALK